MRFWNKIISFSAFCLTLSCSVSEQNNAQKDNLNEQSDSIYITQIPIIHYKGANDQKEAKYFFTITSNEEETTSLIENYVDSFICDKVMDTLRISEFKEIEINFLKSSELTDELMDGKVSDTSSPILNTHYFYVEYRWVDGEFFQKSTHDGVEFKYSFKCN